MRKQVGITKVPDLHALPEPAQRILHPIFRKVAGFQARI